MCGTSWVEDIEKCSLADDVRFSAFLIVTCKDNVSYMVVLGEMLEVGGCIATASKCDVEAVVVGQSLYDSRILHVVANAPNS